MTEQELIQNLVEIDEVDIYFQIPNPVQLESFYDFLPTLRRVVPRIWPILLTTMSVDRVETDKRRRRVMKVWMTTDSNYLGDNALDPFLTPIEWASRILDLPLTDSNEVAWTKVSNYSYWLIYSYLRKVTCFYISERSIGLKSSPKVTTTIPLLRRSGEWVRNRFMLVFGDGYSEYGHYVDENEGRLLRVCHQTDDEDWEWDLDIRTFLNSKRWADLGLGTLKQFMAWDGPWVEHENLLRPVAGEVPLERNRRFASTDTPQTWPHRTNASLNQSALDNMLNMSAIIKGLKVLDNSNPMWDWGEDLIQSGLGYSSCFFTSDVTGFPSGTGSPLRKKTSRLNGCLTLTAQDYREFQSADWINFYRLFSQLFEIQGTGKTFNYPAGV